MRRRDAKVAACLPGENWGQMIQRLYPRGCAEAERRLDREDLLYGWPRVVEIKAEYRRRTRSRRRRG